MKQIDWTKPLITEWPSNPYDKKPARLLGVRKTTTAYSHIVAVQITNDDEVVYYSDAIGNTSDSISGRRFINSPETVTVYMNVYKDKVDNKTKATSYNTDEQAKRVGAFNPNGITYLAIAKPVTFEV
jgi:hypothetical protein